MLRMVRASRASSAKAPVTLPQLGLVCITVGPEVRYKTITRARFLRMDEAQQEAALTHLYEHNLARLMGALSYCHQRGIGLYRSPSIVFPLNDEPIGLRVLERFAPKLKSFVVVADALRVRVVLHPDQFVVLSSLTQQVIDTSIHILSRQAHVFDLLGLPRSPWSAITLHGGKAGRSERLIEVINELPDAIRMRLVLENDEYAYSAQEILDVCRRAGVPMVFDAHHHVIREGLDTYEHPSVARFTRAAAETWPRLEWQIVHLSNGAASFADPRHSVLITSVPAAFRDVPWVEVEAKGKEQAIAEVRNIWPR